MTNLSFAFVFVKTPPENADQFDSVWRYTVPYMRFRHPNIQSRHWVLSVYDAISILDSSVVSSDISIEEIHVYAHANEYGSVWGRLYSRNELYRAISLDELNKFCQTEKKVKTLATKTNKNTHLSFHGCNLGKSPAALIKWMQTFGVTRGSASAPDLFQHFCSGPLHVQAYCPNSKFPFLERDIFSMADIELYINDVVTTSSTQCVKLRTDFASQFRKRVLSDLDKYLKEMFKKLKLGSEISWPDVTTVSEPEAIRRMRILFEQAKGVPITFLARHLQNGVALGSACDEKKLMENVNLGVIFPWHSAQWKNHHHYEPHPPTKVAP